MKLINGQIPKTVKIPEKITDWHIEVAKRGYLLVKKYFNIDLYFTQSLMVGYSFMPVSRIAIITPTQYGKTFTFSLIALLHAAIFNKKVLIGSVNTSKASLIMKSVIENLQAANVDVLAGLQAENKFEKLQTELSKTGLTWKNAGSIQIFSVEAHLVNSKFKGKGAIGEGGDLILVDESAMIDDAVFDSITRMLMRHENVKIMEVSNPHQRGRFEKLIKELADLSIWIDAQTAIEEGRLTEDRVEAISRAMTKRAKRIYIDCEFPLSDTADSFFSDSDLKKAASNKIKHVNSNGWMKVVGVDVARSGKDETVIAFGRKKVDSDDNIYFILDSIKRFKGKKTTEIANYLYNYLKTAYPKEWQNIVVGVDITGIGAGVFDRLDELGLDVYDWISNARATQKDSFANRKSEWIFKLRQEILAGRVRITDKDVLKQMSEWGEDYNSAGKLKIVDPPDSPDLADATLIAFWVEAY